MWEELAEGGDHVGEGGGGYVDIRAEYGAHSTGGGQLTPTQLYIQTAPLITSPLEKLILKRLKTTFASFF